MAPSDDVLAGQAVYNRLVLRMYDVLVLGLSCRLAWRCPKAEMLAQYDRHVGRRHLEMGIGTGYLLDRCRFPEAPELTLLDLNPTVLRYCAARLSRYRPTAVAADVLQPLPVPDGHFDSIGLNFVLHCLPGDWTGKGQVFAHAATALRPGGRLFGSTILGHDAAHNRLGRTLMGVYNRKGVFHNADDDRAGLERQLADHFATYEVRVRGVVALFTARTS
jgi:SAM-dependent methyltransferase